MSPNGRATPEIGAATTSIVEVAALVSPSIHVRHCETLADYAACVRLQSATWGADYRDVVTPSLLKVSRRVGGVVAGAYLETGEMVGFVFGLTGIRGGRPVHWSHMLAVDAAHRDCGVGRSLKEFQWSALRSMGVKAAYWTFDPLVARNAHLNFNRLFASLEEYVPDMYPDTGSDLHAFGTDRFVVSWPIDGGPVRRPEPAPGYGPSPVVNTNGGGGPVLEPRRENASAVRIEIPADIEPMLNADLEVLRCWRASTRAAFQLYLGRGYLPVRFERGPDRGWYVLEAGPGAA